jgi:hypothetical protein
VGEVEEVVDLGGEGGVVVEVANGNGRVAATKIPKTARCIRQ